MAKFYVKVGDFLELIELVKSKHVDEVASFKSSNPGVQLIKAADVNADELSISNKANANHAARAARSAEYHPMGDQLDVIWKQFNHMRLEGTPLIQEADDMLGAILATKKKHPIED